MKVKKSVLMVAPRYRPAIGGVEKHIEKLVERIEKKGMQVTILTKSHQRDLKIQEIVGTTRILRIPFGWDRNPFLVYFWMVYNRQQFMKFNIVHCHDPMPLLQWYLPLRILYRNRPLYATYHGYERDPVPIVFKILRKVANIFVKASMCIGHFIPKIYNMTCNHVTIGAVERTKEYQTERNGIVYIGRIEEDTGILQFIEALAILKKEYGKSSKFIVIGSGSQSASVEELARKHGVDIHLEGISDDPLPLMAKCEICLAAGYLGILEAMSLGLPVIGFARSPLRSEYLKAIIKEGGPISIQTSPEGIAKAIASTLQNPVLAHDIATKGREFAAKFTWDRLVRSYIQLWTSN
ncbi:MAG: glycosyltransferase family 4 protein [Candidatus Thorarchaeota archaeon]